METITESTHQNTNADGKTYFMIGDEFRIFRRDDLNLEIQQYRLIEVKRNRFVTEEYSEYQWKTIGFSGNLKGALVIILKYKIKGDLALDVRTMIQKIENVESHLLDAISNMGLTLQSFPSPEDGRKNNPGRAAGHSSPKAKKKTSVSGSQKRGRGRPRGSKKTINL